MKQTGLAIEEEFDDDRNRISDDNDDGEDDRSNDDEEDGALRKDAWMHVGRKQCKFSSSEDDIRQWTTSSRMEVVVEDKSCLLETLCVQIEEMIGPVLGKSKMIQHPNFPNQFHISKSVHFMIGVFKERIDNKKKQQLEFKEKNQSLKSKIQTSEEYSFLLIQELISKHVSSVEDQSGVYIYCLHRMSSIIQKELLFDRNSTVTNILRIKKQREFTHAINYFVQILLPNVILNELLDDCFDPFEQVKKTYNLCYTFLIPHVNSQIAHTLSKTMMDWLLSLETETIYRLAKDRKLFDFFVNAIPLAPTTENNTKVLPGILIGECSYIYPKSYTVKTNTIMNCIAIKQIERSNKNIQIDIESDISTLQTSVLNNLNKFITILQQHDIRVVICEDILDELMLLELTKHDIICVHHVNDIDRVCETFRVLPLTIHTLTRYNETKRQHELLYFGKLIQPELDNLPSHIFKCKNFREIPFTPTNKLLFIEPIQNQQANISSVIIRAPMESLAEFFKNLFYKLLRYLTNAFKFLTQDPSLPTIASVPGGCFFECKLVRILNYVKRNFHSTTVPQLGKFIDILSQTYESLTVQMISNLMSKSNSGESYSSRCREICLYLQQNESMLISYTNTPTQKETAIFLQKSIENMTPLQSCLISEGLLLSSSSENLGITESLCAKYDTLMNVCLTIRKLLQVDQFFNKQ